MPAGTVPVAKSNSNQNDEPCRCKSPASPTPSSASAGPPSAEHMAQLVDQLHRQPACGEQCDNQREFFSAHGRRESYESLPTAASASSLMMALMADQACRR